MGPLFLLAGILLSIYRSDVGRTFKNLESYAISIEAPKVAYKLSPKDDFAQMHSGLVRHISCA